ncbi:Fatty acid desaturase [compost metagenome]
MGSRKKSFEFPLREKVIFWVSKIVHLSIFIVIPVLVVGWVPTLVGLLISGIACGICLATVFQLAHVVTETEFVALEQTTDATKMENEWMIHQLSSTANFATKNKFLTWILGGLNYQVEHHLFPKISHIHYPAINKLVRETCQEFNVKYLEYKTLNSAFKSHVSVIQSMSR